MRGLKQVLVVGGSVAGMAAALRLRRLGIDVEITEIDPGWAVYGAGLTLTGASLRALEHLEVLPAVRSQGFVSAGTQLFMPDCRPVGLLPAPLGDATVHLGGGIMRPVLHAILASATREAGIRVALGRSVSSLSDDGQQVHVRFSDGEQARYDLVVGADGVYSQLRALLFPEQAPPKFTGQGCWRLIAERPAMIDKLAIVVDYHVPLGFIPVSQRLMYLFLLEHVADADARIEPRDYPQRLRSLMHGLGGAAATVRDAIDADSIIHYRPLESILLPRPWYRGRVVLIGDAAHATTPHLATGTGLAIEDALVLAEELERQPDVDQALCAHSERRYPRCRAVVETSLAIGEAQMTGNEHHVSRMMQEGLGALLQPY
jgi:2-polyprenyl-6-methoxyphenol hydroxylase-like FAD-dependent oxidoreductase